jgi:cytoskeletal protein CcmA (bactofilin family)
MRLQPLLLCLFFLVGVAAAAGKNDPDVVDREAGGDRFSAGGSVSITKPVSADLLVAGGDIDVDTRVGGDVLAVGGNVRLRGDVDAGVIAAGGQLLVNARVKRSVRIAGGQVEIGPKAELGGNLSIAGGQVRVEGPVFGYVQAGGGNVTIDGPVGGDVWVTGGRLALGPNARIAGRLRYASRGELSQDPGAIIKGGVERVEISSGRTRAHTESSSHAFGWVWVAGLMLLAAVLVLAAPAFTTRVSGVLRERPWFSLLIGFIVLVCVPIGAVILLVTIIGLPIGLLALLLYPVLLLIGYQSTAIGISDWVMQRFFNDRARSRWWRVGAAVAAVFVIALLTRLPAIGGFLAFIALIVGLGALALQWRRPAAPATSAA